MTSSRGSEPDLVARLAIALIQAVEFVRDYPLGIEDRYYDERRTGVLDMPETHEAIAMLAASFDDKDGRLS